jgi:signal transduction histidine kinase
MKKSLDSKKAGLRLLAIVAILAVPMVLFAMSYWQQASREILMLEREKLGSELTQMALAHHLAGVKILPEAGLRRIREVERFLGIDEAVSYEKHFYNTVVAQEDHEHGSGNVLGYIADVATVSGLILDSDETSFHMATALTVSLPTLMSDASDVIQHLNLKDSGTNARFQLAKLLGHMQSAFEKMEDAIQRSEAAAGVAFDYTPLIASNKKIEKAIVEYGNQFLFGIASGDGIVMRQQVRNIRSAAQHILVPSYQILNQKLESRKSAAQQRLLYLSMVGLLSAVAALTLAASMFSKTLKRLDDVEVARKQSEEMLIETDRINQEIATLNTNLSAKLMELKSAQDELLIKGKMEQLGQLTATVAHEIRNPLGAVRTSAFLIGRKLQGKNTGIEPQLDRINHGVARCDAIITQLLDFSRTKEVQTQPAQLDDWLEKVLLEDCETLPAAVALECNLGLGTTEVNFDGARLRRAILNLATNACEAMVGQDKDSVAAAKAEPKVIITTRIRGDEICVDVKDNGPGMAADVLMRIREPLFTTKNFGTGLGLPAVEQIAIQHGGRLDIQSTPGVGSTFTICLPLMRSTTGVAA